MIRLKIETQYADQPRFVVVETGKGRFEAQMQKRDGVHWVKDTVLWSGTGFLPAAAVACNTAKKWFEKLGQTA